MSTIAHLDSRKRLNLAPFAKSDIYLVTTEPSGRITLEPAVVLSQLEQAALANPAIIEAVNAYHADPSDVVEED